MAQTTDTDLTTEADVIANETVAEANTKTRVATMIKNIIDSKINNDKIDTANTLDTASKTVAGRDAVKSYIETQITTTTNVSIAGATSLDATAFDKLHLLSGTSYTVDLPTAAGNTGKTIAFKGLVGLTGTVTIDGLTTETIDGETTRAIGSRGVMVFQSDGTNWIVVHEVGSFVAWTPTVAGFTGGSEPTINAKDCRFGDFIFARIAMAGGTSNATTFTITLRYNSKVTIQIPVLVFNSGTAELGNVRLAAGSNVATFFRSGSTAFTATGTKNSSCEFIYEKE